MDFKKLFYIAFFVLLVVLFAIVNLYKGAAYNVSAMFSEANIFKTLAFFLIGAIVVVLAFLKK